MKQGQRIGFVWPIEDEAGSGSCPPRKARTLPGVHAIHVLVELLEETPEISLLGEGLSLFDLTEGPSEGITGD